MADYNAIEVAGYESTPPNYPKSWKGAGAGLQVLYGKYTLAADLSANETIKFGELKKGMVVLGALVKYDDLDTSGGTIDLGWSAGANGDEAADDNGFIDNADVTSADTVESAINLAGAPGIGKEFADDCDLELKIEGDTDATSGDIEVIVWVIANSV